jgi:sialate O-acetylesterase
MINNMKKRLTGYFKMAFFGCLIFCLNSTSAAIRLPAIIGENMVLQRGIKVPIWGTASPGEQITLTFKGKTFKTVTESDGKWFLKLSTYQSGGPYEMLIQSKESNLTLKNILIGDVWLASGQSNMEFGIQTEKSGAAEIPLAKDSLIHMFYVPMSFSITPKDDIAPVARDSRNGKWIVCSPEAMADPKWAWHGFSAVGYYFAKELRKTQKTPVGLIATYKGGTPAQAWMSLSALQQAPSFEQHLKSRQDIVDHFDQAKQEYPDKNSLYQQELKKWNEKQSGTKPQPPANPEGGFGTPSNLFNAMVNPLIPYGIKGVIWYQGESNGDKLPQAVEYSTLFPRLISDWRTKWKQGNFPFLYVQLANYKKIAQTPSEGIWPWVREAQLKTLSLPQTGMAVITDIGDAGDIHPTNKKDVGLRLALTARKIAYSENLVYSGPVYHDMKINGNVVELSFDHTGSGLIGFNPNADSKENSSQKLKGFGIAGADGNFVWADAVIEGNKIKVFSDKIANPIAVRYNWADNPVGTLYNKEGLPASPFRTDKNLPKL